MLRYKLTSTIASYLKIAVFRFFSETKFRNYVIHLINTHDQIALRVIHKGMERVIIPLKDTSDYANGGYIKCLDVSAEKVLPSIGVTGIEWDMIKILSIHTIEPHNGVMRNKVRLRRAYEKKIRRLYYDVRTTFAKSNVKKYCYTLDIRSSRLTDDFVNVGAYLDTSETTWQDYSIHFHHDHIVTIFFEWYDYYDITILDELINEEMMITVYGWMRVDKLSSEENKNALNEILLSRL